MGVEPLEILGGIAGVGLKLLYHSGFMFGIWLGAMGGALLVAVYAWGYREKGEPPNTLSLTTGIISDRGSAGPTHVVTYLAGCRRPLRGGVAWELRSF
jgi:hypothetical protein